MAYRVRLGDGEAAAGEHCEAVGELELEDAISGSGVAYAKANAYIVDGAVRPFGDKVNDGLLIVG